MQRSTHATHRLGFIGAGNMAEAIVRAAIEREVLRPEQIIAFDPTPGRRAIFAAMGITIASGNGQVVAAAEQVMLAIKPQMLDSLADDFAQFDVTRQIVISIMAGIGSQRIARVIGGEARVVRVMPNTPMLVGQGMSAVAGGEHSQAGDDDLAVRLFAAGGKAIRVPEQALDAITAVSGSGPAYLFYLAEAMEQAAEALGVGEHARLLVQQTLLGAATLLAQSPDTAAELRRKVTSPGGTTQAALEHMDREQVGGAIVAAIEAACQRARELGT